MILLATSFITANDSSGSMYGRYGGIPSGPGDFFLGTRANLLSSALVSSLSMSLGWRLEWWDDSISYPFGNDIIKEEVEWNGSALDLTFDKRF